MWALFKLKDYRVMFTLHGLITAYPLYLLATYGTPLNKRLFLLGMIYANFMEYYNHKVNFHTIPNWFENKRFYYVMHGHHHKYPDANPVTPLPQTLFLYLVSDLVFRLFFPERHMHVLAGGAFGFMVFELSHVFIHKVEREKWDNWWTPWLRPMIDFHLTHHVDSRSTFGFTSPFWDWCAGDLPAKDKYQWRIIPIPLPIIPFLIAKAIHKEEVVGRKDVGKKVS
jgi:sterol desaturase/sphingolipid hydroxylase (fatty acid hydroxylase superfamily)